MLTFNRTLGVWTFSIPARQTCPGKSEWCRKNCYATKGNFLCANAQMAHDRNWNATKDLEAFEASMVAEIKRRMPLALRVHSSGDFYSVEYFRAWLRIAKQCPETKVFAYTRTWRIDRFAAVLPEAEKVANFVLWYSTDPATGVPEKAKRVAYILDSESYGAMPEPNCLKQLDKRQNCLTCRRCWDRRKRKVCFLKH